MSSKKAIYSRASLKDSAVAAAEGFIALVMRYPPEERRRFLKAVRSRLMMEKGDIGNFIRGEPLMVNEVSTSEDPPA